MGLGADGCFSSQNRQIFTEFLLSIINSKSLYYIQVSDLAIYWCLIYYTSRRGAKGSRSFSLEY